MRWTTSTATTAVVHFFQRCRDQVFNKHFILSHYSEAGKSCASMRKQFKMTAWALELSEWNRTDTLSYYICINIPGKLNTNVSTSLRVLWACVRVEREPVCVYVWVYGVRERERECLCVCACEFESVSMCVWMQVIVGACTFEYMVRERDRVCMCRQHLYVRVRLSERVRERQS